MYTGARFPNALLFRATAHTALYSLPVALGLCLSLTPSNRSLAS